MSCSFTLPSSLLKRLVTKYRLSNASWNSIKTFQSKDLENNSQVIHMPNDCMHVYCTRFGNMRSVKHLMYNSNLF